MCVSVAGVASECTAAGAGGSGLAAVAIAACGEDMGEKLREECAGAGEGRADDGDVAFDGGPGGGADVVVCSKIVRLFVVLFLEGTRCAYRLDHRSWR